MDDNTEAVIASSARHAVGELEGILEQPGDPDHVWHCLQAAGSRLAYIEEMLREAGHERPS